MSGNVIWGQMLCRSDSPAAWGRIMGAWWEAFVLALGQLLTLTGGKEGLSMAGNKGSLSASRS